MSPHDANGGRYRSTLQMPQFYEMRSNATRGVFEIVYDESRFARREIVTFDEMIERGWYEPEPWPIPSVVGSFA